MAWSKLGTYLTTVQHDKDIVLLCGEQLQEYRRFTHQGVKGFDISPREKYLITHVAQEEYEVRCVALFCASLIVPSMSECSLSVSPSCRFRGETYEVRSCVDSPELPFGCTSHTFDVLVVKHVFIRFAV